MSTRSSSPRRASASGPTSASTTRRRRTTRCSCAGATSTATRSSVQFESGNDASPNLGIRNTELNTATAIAGWTKILSPTMVNEFRVGYNYDNSARQSHYTVERGERAARPRDGAQPHGRPPRLPVAQLRGRLGGLAPHERRRTAAATPTARSARTRSRSATTSAWCQGGHSLKFGRALDAQQRGRRLRQGRQLPRPVPLQQRRTGNALANMLLGTTRDAGDHITQRGDLDGTRTTSRSSPRTTGGSTTTSRCSWACAGSSWEPGTRTTTCSPTSSPRRAATTSCPVPRSAAAAAARAAGARPDPLRERRGAQRRARQHRQEQLQPARRLRVARRRQRQDRAAGRLRALPPDRGGAGRARPARRERVPLHAALQRRSGSPHAFSRGTPFVDPADFGNQGVDPDLQSPGHLPVQPELSSRSCPATSGCA